MRIFKRILLSVIAVLLLLVFFDFVIEPATWHWRVRRKSLTILSAARSTNELQQAVGFQGIFIPLRDGSWIAIRYCDTHGGRIESLAVARDSGGGWFQSDHHFCGAFVQYRQERQSLEAIRMGLAKPGETDTNTINETGSETFAFLNAAFAAPSLEVGRQQLLKLGFQPFTK